MRFRRKIRDAASVIAQCQPGEALAFSGTSLVSRAIQIGTFSPYSHVAIVVRVRRKLLQELYDSHDLPRLSAARLHRWGLADRLVLFEATTLCDSDCLLMGRPVRGVQCHEIADRVATYEGRCWRVPLNDDYRLTSEMQDQLARFMLRKVGDEYDDRGAIKAGWRAVVGLSLHNQETRKWFCDKLAAEGMKSIGRFPMVNTDTFTPASYVRQGQRIGIFDEVTGKERIK